MKLKSLLLIMLLFLPFSAWCKDGDFFVAETIDGLSMRFKVVSEESKTCVVASGTMGTTAVDKEATGKCTIPSVAGGYTVVGIDQFAFNKCANLTSVVIPNTIVSIEMCAFQACTKISELQIPNSVSKIGNGAFYHCESLTSISIPDGVGSIYQDSFNSCISLVSLYIGNGVKWIDDHAFYNCPLLQNISVSLGNTNYDSRDNCNAIIESATNKLVLGCRTTVIPETVEIIGKQAFNNCQGLESIRLPESLLVIEDRAFYESNLKSIYIPSRVNSIGNYVFSYCESLQSITVSEGNMQYDSRQNCNSIIETKSNTLIVGCKNSTIPETVEHIGAGSFYGCLGLENIEIPSGIKSIGDYAFWGCNGLVSVKSNITDPFDIGDGTFTYYDRNNWQSSWTSAKLSIPVGSKNKYLQAKGWNKFQNISEVSDFIKGDVNGDKEVDISDILCVVSYIMGNPSEDFNETAADANEDGVVNVADIVEIINKKK